MTTIVLLARKNKLKNKIYALYKGDEFMFLGTMQEISKKLNINMSNLYKIKNRTKRGLVKDKGMVLFEVEGDADEEREIKRNY